MQFTKIHLSITHCSILDITCIQVYEIFKTTQWHLFIKYWTMHINCQGSISSRHGLMPTCLFLLRLWPQWDTSWFQLHSVLPYYFICISLSCPVTCTSVQYISSRTAVEALRRWLKNLLILIGNACTICSFLLSKPTKFLRTKIESYPVYLLQMRLWNPVKRLKRLEDNQLHFLSRKFYFRMLRMLWVHVITASLFSHFRFCFLWYLAIFVICLVVEYFDTFWLSSLSLWSLSVSFLIITLVHALHPVFFSSSLYILRLHWFSRLFWSLVSPRPSV